MELSFHPSQIVFDPDQWRASQAVTITAVARRGADVACDGVVNAPLGFRMESAGESRGVLPVIPTPFPSIPRLPHTSLAEFPQMPTLMASR